MLFQFRNLAKKNQTKLLPVVVPRALSLHLMALLY
jgi:hypothetical protein